MHTLQCCDYLDEIKQFKKSGTVLVAVMAQTDVFLTLKYFDLPTCFDIAYADLWTFSVVRATLPASFSFASATYRV